MLLSVSATHYRRKAFRLLVCITFVGISSMTRYISSRVCDTGLGKEPMNGETRGVAVIRGILWAGVTLNIIPYIDITGLDSS